MNKRQFIAPYILLSGTGLEGDDSGTVIGGGTGHGSTNAVPCSFEAWLNSTWASDLIQNGTIDEYDFAAWWENNNFSQEDWEDLNPDLPWEDYFD